MFIHTFVVYATV